MRTFIFVKSERDEHGNLKKYIAGMVQSDSYPSDLRRNPDSEFYLSEVIEVKEHCHIYL